MKRTFIRYWVTISLLLGDILVLLGTKSNFFLLYQHQQMEELRVLSKIEVRTGRLDWSFGRNEIDFFKSFH